MQHDFNSTSQAQAPPPTTEEEIILFLSGEQVTFNNINEFSKFVQFLQQIDAMLQNGSNDFWRSNENTLNYTDGNGVHKVMEVGI